MSRLVPLGEAEGQRLEFKGKDALKHLPNVSREVVAMLNSGGGEIWVGLTEDRGHAVQVEPIEHPEREINRLRDHLSDAIEPSPISREIEVEQIPCNGDGTVLKLSVRPSKTRTPYALREGTARHFLKRVSDRMRTMTREEIIPRQSGTDSVRDLAVAKLKSARERRRVQEIFWLRIQPVNANGLKFEKSFQEYFRDHQRTGNRYAGWNFIDPYRKFHPPTADGIVFGQGNGICVRILHDGAIEFSMPLVNLYWKSADGSRGADANEIWPYCLLEYPTSVFRLAGTIYKEHGLNADIFLGDIALFGIRGWTLRPHSPKSFGYRFAKPKAAEFDEIVLDEPANFTREQIIDQPDRCAFRLVTQIYWKFGLWEEDMPVEFDQDTGKLVLPGP
jgi:hypothetical protein